MAHLVLRNIRKTYGSTSGARVVLAGIDLSVKTDDFAVLVGPSGCGKTTLLKIIAGMVRPDPEDFELSVDGLQISGPGPDRGMVFQQYHSYPWLSVLDNVKFGLDFMSISDEDKLARAEQQLKA